MVAFVYDPRFFSWFCVLSFTESREVKHTPKGAIAAPAAAAAAAAVPLHFCSTSHFLLAKLHF